MYYQVRISATSEEEAKSISRMLVEKHLVAWTMYNKWDCHYWWDWEIYENEYWNIRCSTIGEKKEEIIEAVKKVHRDKCPIIEFTEITWNSEYLNWISDSIK